MSSTSTVGPRVASATSARPCGTGRDRTSACWPAVAAGLLLLVGGACDSITGEGHAASSSAGNAGEPCADPAAAREALELPRGEGGFAVTAEWLRDNRCGVRVVDLREPNDLIGAGGHIAGAEAVPIRAVPQTIATQDSTDPFVFVCENGTRSRGTARLLESMGFSRAAFLGGGMTAWTAAGYPVSHVDRDIVHPVLHEDETIHSEVREAPEWAHSDDESLQHVREHFAPEDIRWVKIGDLMLSGHAHCVDGRDDDHFILGTPGGDAGQLILLLATVEGLHHEPLDITPIPQLVSDYIDAFGDIYMHTDTHALEHLLEALHEDLRFEGHLPEPGDLPHAELFITHPPRDLRPYLLEYIFDPHSVGCGHLRLVLEHPEEYGVRPELARAVIGAIFERLWSGEEGIDYEVLEGEHLEGAVVNVTVPHPVRTFTWVPTVRPAEHGTQIFINHPQVSELVRRQAALFLIDREPWMHLRPREETAFLVAVDELAATQIMATVNHLAPTLSVFEVHFEGGQASVERMR